MNVEKRSEQCFTSGYSAQKLLNNVIEIIEYVHSGGKFIDIALSKM